MLTNLMNYIFVFSIGILTGTLFAFEVFQKQLETLLINDDSLFKEYITLHGWYWQGRKKRRE